MEWMPIETADKEGPCILVFAPDDWSGDNIYVAYYQYGRWVYSEGGSDISPTHWMHLPKSPKILINEKIMMKELIAQRRAIDEQIPKVRSREGKSKIKELIKEYGLTPEYLHKLATRLKEKGVKK